MNLSLISSETMLLASPNTEYMIGLQETLSSRGFHFERVSTGKEAQALLYKKTYGMVLLDLELSDFSSIEVLKYIKLTRQTIKVLLFAKSKNQLTELSLDEQKLKKLGILDTFFSSLPHEKLLEKIQLLSHMSAWKDIRKSETVSEQKEYKILDSDLTRVPVNEVIGSNIAIFDHYIKLATDKYVKIVHEGEAFPADTIEKYAASGTEYLYFLASDRATYINFMNELAGKIISSGKATPTKIVSILKNTTDKYIEEVYTRGIRPELIDEGRKICQNIFHLVSRDGHLKSLLNSFEENFPEEFSHNFLVTFYTVLICKNIDWVGTRSLETIALASLFHDIGMLKLPPEICQIKGRPMDKNELELFQQHPRLGAEMLADSANINEQVRQIIYQHHEHVTGNGYPNKLTGLKIYPLAKIVSFAEAFAETMEAYRLSPRQAMKVLLHQRNIILQYDAAVVRALVKGLT